MAERRDQCWPGYEPVKGKRQHEQGSCRPKAESKLTPPEKDVRRKRRRQLDKWQAEHPHARKSAAQHLHAPDEKSRSKATGARAGQSSKKKNTAKKKK
jgi:hypothetical protein